ncbi:Drought-responsive family protein [Hibiscus syriacus]|uniref:Drought-responsive family protein n=1 Tax=Hibiscus syriacus TaxID=106335 RepID=A0A6A2X0M7_HIBSY|nr:uncharacterized protein LOC120178521 [Hibiscus syriacus]KAE8667948.1 Drought-responsive family protein [Hibiscus syriacus]
MSSPPDVVPFSTRRGRWSRFNNLPPKLIRQLKRQRLEQRPLVPNRLMADNRTDQQEHTASSTSSPVDKSDNNPTNWDLFLEFTTPVVRAQHIPMDLWKAFEEWSAYGAGIPLLLNGTCPVTQYYVPFLSAIQLYIDPSRPPSQRKPGEESNTESSRETTSRNGSNNAVQGAQSHIETRDRPSQGSSISETNMQNPPGQLVFEYFEHALPFTREPLACKISDLASRFPALTRYRSCDLLPSSWISEAWYPIYRIPTGPTMKTMDTCFLTYHCLSTQSPGTETDCLPFRGFNIREFSDAEMSSKLPLPTLGVAFYKFQVSLWDTANINTSPKVDSLWKEADNWLRCLQVYHPDFIFFLDHRR